MNLFYLLAQTPPSGPPPPAPEGWLSYVLGPLGALVLMIVYAWYTEKKRIPKMQVAADDLAAKLEEAGKAKTALEAGHRAELDGLRKYHDARKAELTEKIDEWQARHTKERGVRAWYQAKGQALAKDAGKQLGPPPDIEKTHYPED
jgi:hypothetical protein